MRIRQRKKAERAEKNIVKSVRVNILVCFVYYSLVYVGISCWQLLGGIINNEQGIGKNILNGAIWFVCFDFKPLCLSVFDCIS